MISSAVLLTLAMQCAPTIHPDTSHDVARVESGLNPFAIGVVGQKKGLFPSNINDALDHIDQLKAKGKNYSVGLMQINQANFSRYGVTAKQLFNPCTNLTVFEKIITDCYLRGGTLKRALSCYYSGNFDTGQKPEAAKIEAEQAPGAPVLIIPQSNGSIAPTFNVIQTDYKNLHAMLGGTLHYAKEDSEKKNPIGWTAPQAALLMQGPFELELVSGRSILIPNGTLLSNLGGKLTLTETAKIECTLEVAMPEDGSQPYGVFDSKTLPEEWGEHKLPAAGAAAAASVQSEEATSEEATSKEG
mgnify:CR=1 FL=1